MELGICTRYTHHEATFAAIRLADAAVERGVDTSIFTMTERPIEIDSRWDRHVARNVLANFIQWADAHDHILWTAVPHTAQLHWVRQQKKRTSIFVLWHELNGDCHQSLLAADQLICPSLACYKMLLSWNLKNCIYMPWDCGQPLHTKPADHSITHPRLLLPMWDGNPRRSELTIIDIIRLALQRHPTVEITVACNSSTMRSCAMRRLLSLRAAGCGRLTIQKRVRPAARFSLFQSHDLTLWPSHCESTGMTGLQSIEMGTPVLGFKYRPTDEILTQHNSITVRCAEELNSMGMPCAIPDYSAFDHLLHHVLRDTEYLQSLQQTVLLGVRQRRLAFQDAITRVLL